MMRLLFNIVFIISLLAAISAAAVYRYVHTPNTLSQDTTVIIKKGMGAQAIAAELGKAGIIHFPTLFLVTQYALKNTHQFKAGEYAFAPHMTPLQVADKLVRGEVIIHKVTIPEGWNIREVRAALLAEPILTGDLTRNMSEGSVLPETYHFVYGDTRDHVADRMQQALTQFLDEAWQYRASGLPLATKQDALVLASIVEKETGVAGERARVAAVFINRLRLGMRLQTDPSVVYGLELEKGDALERALTTKDLETPTPYNSYLNAGLPPGPIANPGKDAILATLHPLETDELYFVATGTGGHYFAKTLEEHNRNVAAYRQIRTRAE